MVDSHTAAQYFVQKIIPKINLLNFRKGLVVGFGEGHEADYLSLLRNCSIFGIDIHQPVQVSHTFFPTLSDARNLPYPSDIFDFVFYHHVIEHVSEPEKTLSEIQRVLHCSGLLFIGTPNRRRIIGYVGSYQVSMISKIRWNLQDYQARRRGRFKNEIGAHAGFTKKELSLLLEPYFSKIVWVTEPYLQYKYMNRIPNIFLRLLHNARIIEVGAPAIYAICYK